MAGLRRNFNKDERCLNLKKDEIVIVEHADWSNDRMRNSFAILQCSCTQNGMLMQWTMEGGNNNFLYVPDMLNPKIASDFLVIFASMRS